MRLLAVVLLLLTLNLFSQGYAAEPYHQCLSAGIKKSVVFLGTIVKPELANPSGRAYFGTGFLTAIDKIMYLFTAKHVIEKFREGGRKDEEMSVFVNGQDGKVRVRSVADIKNVLSADWVFGKNSDVAVIPFTGQADFDTRQIDETLFLDLAALLELQDLFFISFQPGIDDQTSITPITRRGMVSIINTDRTFYMDAFAFPGNSGSPVFIKPSPVTVPAKGKLRTGDPIACRLVGLIGSYLPYRDVAVSQQTKQPRIMFEENTGLARVWSIDAVQEVIKSSPFQAQHSRLKELASK